MRKKKTDRAAIIDCGNKEYAYLAYIAMFSYAFGRMTYMPDVVIITKTDAEIYFVKETELDDRDPLYWQVFANWLFSPATERKGECDA